MAEESPSLLGRLYDEANRRRVPKVLATYGVAAWTIVQIAATSFPLIGLSQFATTLVLILVVVGAPIVFFISWNFDLTSKGLVRTSAAGAAPKPLIKLPRLAQIALLLGVLLVGGLALAKRRPVLNTEALDANQVAVLPFRVTGADPAVHYLSEGMVDLLATVFTGEGGPRAPFSARTLRAWREANTGEQKELTEDDARVIAQRVGAGQVLVGEVTGPATRIVLSATILDVGTGRVRARARVTGGVDSLVTLVDQLGADLLSDESGQPTYRLATLATASLPALRAFIEAAAAARQGKWDLAIRQYQAALQLDSTFVLAAYQMLMAMSWVGGIGSPDANRAFDLVWRSREHLPPFDRTLLEAMTGPDRSKPWPLKSRVAQTERALALAPDDPRVWAQIGELAVHAGGRLGWTDASERAKRAFAKAMELDSTNNFEYKGHLVDILIEERDTAWLRQLFPEARSPDPAIRAEAGKYIGLWLALLANDTPALQIIRAGFAQHLGRMPGYVATAQEVNLGLDDAEHAARLMLAHATTERERADALRSNITLALNRGRPSQAVAFRRQQVEVDSQARANARTARVYDALYADGDVAAAEAALRDMATRPAKAGTPPYYNELCAAGQWRLLRSENGNTRRSIQELRAVGNPHQTPTLHVCAWLLESLLAARENHGDGVRALDSLEASLDAALTPLIEYRPIIPIAYLNAARLAEQLGLYPRALALLRRGAGGLYMLPTYLHEEGRMAALAGETAAAVRAYSRYLALRSDPEATLQPKVARVREEYFRLMEARPR